MAVEKKSFTANKSMIDFENMKLVQETKDSTLVYDLNEILRTWDKVEDVTFTIQSTKDIEPSDTEY